jgi:nitroimidazol reductase NimA-like FMN-containing flavoprotein (pyridoxamine 5'-phosphate oxidase superfamily)
MIGKLNDEQIEAVLKESMLGRIGCNDGSKTYIVPINYVYEGGAIIAHSVAGMKIEMMRKNPKVCFEVDTVRSFNDWKSVIAWGEFQEITDETERYKAMKIFVDRMMHMKLSENAAAPEINENRVHPRSPGNIQLIVYRIILSKKTGRFEI